MEKVIIQNKEICYEKVYRNVRYARLEFKKKELFVVLPKGYKKEEEFIRSHQRWILKTILFYDRIIEESKKLSLNLKADVEEFKSESCRIIGEFSEDLNVGEINKIVFRKLKSKWGSCGSDGKITVNNLLRFLPEELMRYILFHEVAHRIVRKHNKKFYDIIKGKFENMKRLNEQLTTYWFLLEEYLSYPENKGIN